MSPARRANLRKWSISSAADRATTSWSICDGADGSMASTYRCGPPISQSAWMASTRRSRSMYSGSCLGRSFCSTRSENTAPPSSAGPTAYHRRGMPELPDLTVYLDFLQGHIVGQTLERIRLASPFVLRTADPPLKAAENKRVLGLRRSGKRLIFELDDDLFLMIHLMIAGRFRWKEQGAAITGKIGLAAFDFSNGTLLLTEASQKKRAAIHLFRGEDALADFDRGGLEPLDADYDQFRSRLLAGNHTIKRALTDPDLFSGIGNAYSDEILHRAKLS